MTTICAICGGTVKDDGSPPIIIDGDEMVSHSMHPACAIELYGEDFKDILAGEPT